MFEITFLGTSGGTPTVERGLPSLAIRYESELLLFDCGEGTQRQLMKYKVGYGSIDNIFITHPHLDHYLGMFGLLETLKLSSVKPRPLGLYLPPEIDSTRFDSYGFVKVSKNKTGELYQGKDFSVHGFRVKHCKNSFGFLFAESEKIKFHEEKAHSLGLSGKMFREIQSKGKVKTPDGKIVRLEEVSWQKPGRRIVYGGDCAFSESLLEQSAGADLLIHEATFDNSRTTEAMERMHSTAQDAAELAKRAGVKKLILTHISPRYSDPAILLEQARAIFPNTIVAYDGLKVVL